MDKLVARVEGLMDGVRDITEDIKYYKKFIHVLGINNAQLDSMECYGTYRLESVLIGLSLKCLKLMDLFYYNLTDKPITIDLYKLLPADIIRSKLNEIANELGTDHIDNLFEFNTDGY